MKTVTIILRDRGLEGGTEGVNRTGFVCWRGSYEALFITFYFVPWYPPLLPTYILYQKLIQSQECSVGNVQRIRLSQSHSLHQFHPFFFLFFACCWVREAFLLWKQLNNLYGSNVFSPAEHVNRYAVIGFRHTALSCQTKCWFQ